MPIENGEVIQCPNCGEQLVYKHFKGGSFCPLCSQPIIPSAIPSTVPHAREQAEESSIVLPEKLGSVSSTVITGCRKLPSFLQLMVLGFVLAILGMTVGGFFGGMIQTVMAGGGVILVILGFMQMEKYRKRKT